MNFLEMIYFKDYPGFTCGSKSPDSRFLVWDSNFSEDFVYIILGRITTSIYGDSERYVTLEEAMQAIRHEAIIKYFSDEY
jgi:hypothetical protein